MYQAIPKRLPVGKLKKMSHRSARGLMKFVVRLKLDIESRHRRIKLQFLQSLRQHFLDKWPKHVAVSEYHKIAHYLVKKEFSTLCSTFISNNIVMPFPFFKIEDLFIAKYTQLKRKKVLKIKKNRTYFANFFLRIYQGNWIKKT